MKRREFIIRIGGAAFAAPVMASLAACGDDGDDGGATPDAAPSVVDCATFEIGPPDDGHPLVTITAADVNAGDTKQYDLLEGASSHTHQFTISQEQFATLASGGQVIVTSTESNLHTHSVTISMCTS